jgi:hypothetical protein
MRIKLSFTLTLALIIFAQGFIQVALAQGERSSRARQVGASSAPAAEAVVTLNEQFLNSFLEAMFTRLRGPQFPLSLTKLDRQEETPDASALETQAMLHHVSFSHALAPREVVGPTQCASVIVLEREMGGVRTAVRFEQGRISAPLAFSGSYSVSLLGCIRFQGWADTTISLSFNRERQVLSAQVQVQDVRLSGVPGLASGVIVGLVQNAIDQRINPVEILQAAQLSARIPIAAAGGALRLMAREVRPEIIPGALRLHIIYEFEKAD